MTLALPLFLLVQAAVAVEPPATIVRRAARAVEAGDAASAVVRWQAALARDSTDAGAHLALATIARRTYDTATAERHFAAIVASRNITDPRYQAWVALGRAELRLFRDPHDSAAASLASAASLANAAGDSVAAAEALLGLAQAQARTTSASSARRTIDSALRFVPARDTGFRSEGLCTRSLVRWTIGDRKFGEDAEVGFALARTVGDRRREGMCLITLGIHNLTIGEDAKASELLDSAVAITTEVHDRSVGAVALWWRGNHHLELYEHDAARRVLSSVLTEAEASGNRFIAGWAWNRLAVVSWHFTDMLSARRELDRGRAIFRGMGDGWGIANSRYFDGAMALDAGQIDAAEAALRDDLEWAVRLQQPLEQFTATFGLARAAVSRRDWTVARARFDEATRIARRNRLFGYLPQLEYEYGLIALKRGDLAEAEQRFRAVLTSGNDLSDLDRYAARSRIAEIHVLRGDLERAEHELTSATDAIDSLRSALNDKELRVLAFQAHKGFDDDLGFANIIGGLSAGGRVDAALALAERRRARELRDRLAQAATRLTRDLGAPATRRFTDDHTAVLEYVTGTGSQPTTLFVLTPRGTTALRRPPADSIAPDIAAFTRLLEAGAGASALAQQLGRVVFGDVLDTLSPNVSRLIVVGDGPLQHLPFDALRMGDGRYVVQRFAVSIAPSVAVAAHLDSRDPENATLTRILAFGDPQFANEVPPSGGSAADIYREAFSLNGGLPRLRGSAAEARLVARFATASELRLRERASESYLKRTPLDSFDIIHLATHALVDDRSAARTALAVADGDGDDGFVGPGELSALRLDARLVVLSACRTAQGVTVRGEGVQGLTAPLLAAGARSVLATQWRIRDTDAVQFIDDFYRALAKGNTVSEAARSAKLAAIARGAAPATWAAFSVVGDPLVTVALRAPSDRTRVVLFATVLAVAVLLGYGGVIRMRRAGDTSSVPSDSRAETVQ